MKSRRRGRNEGSIFQRSDGRWCAQLDLGWQNGRRARKYVYGATAAEVQEVLLKARADQSRGLPVAPGRQTVEQFLPIGWRIRLGLQSGRQPIEAMSKPSGTISYPNWVGCP
jgi:hypothetical protein